MPHGLESGVLLLPNAEGLALLPQVAAKLLFLLTIHERKYSLLLRMEKS